MLSIVFRDDLIREDMSIKTCVKPFQPIRFLKAFPMSLCQNNVEQENTKLDQQKHHFYKPATTLT